MPSLKAENAALRAQITELAALREQVALLTEQVQTLQARLAKDSHNSGKAAVERWVQAATAEDTQPAPEAPGRSRVGNWATPARRCIWWPSPTKSSNTVPVSVRTLSGAAGSGRGDGGGVRAAPSAGPASACGCVSPNTRRYSLRCPACQQVTVGAFPAGGSQSGAVRATVAGAGGVPRGTAVPCPTPACGISSLTCATRASRWERSWSGCSRAQRR